MYCGDFYVIVYSWCLINEKRLDIKWVGKSGDGSDEFIGK